MISWATQTAGRVYVGSKVGNLPVLAAESYANQHEILRDKIKPRKIYTAPEEINFANLAQHAYKEGKDREVSGYNILPEFTTPDKVTYQHKATGHVVVAFRGTDPDSWKGGLQSKSFRDLSTDLLLGVTGSGATSHRFHTAETLTGAVVKKFGKQNVSVTGHSLGGSQAMHVSRKFDLHGHVYNPHTTWSQALTGAYFPQLTLHQNVTDPISSFHYGATFGKKDIRESGFLLGAHGMENFVASHPKHLLRTENLKSVPKRNYAVQ
jgi:hypothetical protein